MDSDGYPWYAVVQGEDLAQGDLFDRCPVFLPPADMVEPSEEASFSWQERDLTDNTPCEPRHRGLPARQLTAFDVRAATRRHGPATGCVCLRSRCDWKGRDASGPAQIIVG